MWNLAQTAMQYERAMARLNAIKDAKDIYDTRDAPAGHDQELTGAEKREYGIEE